MRAVIDRLRALGYRVVPEGDFVTWKWEGQDSPDPATVRPLIDRLKKNKNILLRILRLEREPCEPFKNPPGLTGIELADYWLFEATRYLKKRK